MAAFLSLSSGVALYKRPSLVLAAQHEGVFHAGYSQK